MVETFLNRVDMHGYKIVLICVHALPQCERETPVCGIDERLDNRLGTIQKKL